LAYSTEKSYCGWGERYFGYVGEHDLPVREPSSVRAFLSKLATRDRLASSSQNQAFSALLMLFRDVFHVELEDLARRFARSGVESCRWC